MSQELLLCVGPARTGTTWLWENLKSKYNTYQLKESYVWCDKPFPDFPVISQGKHFSKTIAEYYDTIEQSEKPWMDFSLGWYQASRDTSIIKELDKRFDLTVYLWVRDPYETWISTINHTSWWTHTRTTMGEVFDREARYFTTPEGVDILNRKLRQHATRKIETADKLLYAQNKYGTIIPSWLDTGVNLVLLDFNKLGDSNAILVDKFNYFNRKLGMEHQWDFMTRYSQERNIIVTDDTIDPGVKAIVKEMYKNDYEYLNAIKDKYK
jgi:hypothetical protein